MVKKRTKKQHGALSQKVPRAPLSGMEKKDLATPRSAPAGINVQEVVGRSAPAGVNVQEALSGSAPAGVNVQETLVALPGASSIAGASRTSASSYRTTTRMSGAELQARSTAIESIWVMPSDSAFNTSSLSASSHSSLSSPSAVFFAAKFDILAARRSKCAGSPKRERTCGSECAGNSGGASRRILDSWRQPDFREFLQNDYPDERSGAAGSQHGY